MDSSSLASQPASELKKKVVPPLCQQSSTTWSLIRDPTTIATRIKIPQEFFLNQLVLACCALHHHLQASCATHNNNIMHVEHEIYYYYIRFAPWRCLGFICWMFRAILGNLVTIKRNGVCKSIRRYRLIRKSTLFGLEKKSHMEASERRSSCSHLPTSSCTSSSTTIQMYY